MTEYIKNKKFIKNFFYGKNLKKIYKNVDKI